MTPITQYQHDYLLAWEETSDNFFLLFSTTYEHQIESACIQLPSNIKAQYIKEGHGNLIKWIKRIDEDYQVGRFSKDNPRLMMEYILATDAQKTEILNCFENNISLIEQEAIRLFYLMDKNLTAGNIFHNLKEGKRIPIEIFCLAFWFYEKNKPLVDQEGNTLIEKASAEYALQLLQQSPVFGCPDAALMLLGALTHQKDAVHLNCLHNIIDQLNCRYIIQELNNYIEQAAYFNYVTINDLQGDYKSLIHQFQNTFPKWPNFSLKTIRCLANWSFMESSVAWQSEYLHCLIKSFASQKITISRSTADNLLCLPSGKDSEWNSYSIGQAIKYCPVDTSEFTQQTVSKPFYDSKRYEDFIVAVWQHYFYYFTKTEYPKNQLRAVLDEFVLNWNRA